MDTSIDSTLNELRSSLRNPLAGMPGGDGSGGGMFKKLAGAFVVLLVLLFLVQIGRAHV